MQGRLSQKENLPLQSFPFEWEQEFSRARDIGFMKIEWLQGLHERHTVLLTLVTQAYWTSTSVWMS